MTEKNTKLLQKISQSVTGRILEDNDNIDVKEIDSDSSDEYNVEENIFVGDFKSITRDLNGCGLTITQKRDLKKKTIELNKYISKHVKNNTQILYCELFRDISYTVNQYNLELCETYMSYCTNYFLDGVVPKEDVPMILDYHDKYIFCK